MCGIAGLFSKSVDVSEGLGSHLGDMLLQLSDRGPDSAGVAVYRDPAPSGSSKVSLFSPDPAQPVVVRKRPVVDQAEVEPGRERVRVLRRHAALGRHPRVAKGVRPGHVREPKALDELPRRPGLLEDLDRLARAHHAQLGVALVEPRLGLGRIGLHHDHGM